MNEVPKVGVPLMTVVGFPFKGVDMKRAMITALLRDSLVVAESPYCLFIEFMWVRALLHLTLYICRTLFYHFVIAPSLISSSFSDP